MHQFLTDIAPMPSCPPGYESYYEYGDACREVAGSSTSTVVVVVGIVVLVAVAATVAALVLRGRRRTPGDGAGPDAGPDAGVGDVPPAP